MKTRKLITIMPHKYGTRHLTAGDEYEASPSHALALVFSKRARYADKPVERPETDKLEALRLEALRLGVAVDGRWGIARLQNEIAQARSG